MVQKTREAKSHIIAGSEFSTMGQKLQRFFLTSLGKDRMILGYPFYKSLTHKSTGAKENFKEEQYHYKAQSPIPEKAL